MMYPWMFQEIEALKPFAAAADLPAAHKDWPRLYDPEKLPANEVPILAAIYHDDMYVDADLQLRTAREVGNTRVGVTDEHEDEGLRRAGDSILGHLRDMAAGRR